jgi:hypothetical protein
MKPLNRPMFRMGGPIKEGIMDGIEEPRQGFQDGTPPGFFGLSFNKPVITGANTKKFFQNLFKSPNQLQAEKTQQLASIFEPDYSMSDYGKVPTIKKDLLASKKDMVPGDTGKIELVDQNTISTNDLDPYTNLTITDNITATESQDDAFKGTIPKKSTFEEKMSEGMLKKGTPDNKTMRMKIEEGVLKKGPQKPEADSELLQKLGYDRAVKRGNYQLIEAIRQGLTEGGVQGALDAAFAAGAGDPYAEASKIKQAAALKEYEMELEEKKYKERRGDKLEDQIKLLEKKKELGVDKPESKSITEKTYEFLVEDLKMDPDEAKRVAIKEHRTINEAVIDVQKQSGLAAITVSVLDGAGGVFYGNEYRGKVSPDKQAVDGWYLQDKENRFIEIKDGKIVDSSREFEVAK